MQIIKWLLGMSQEQPSTLRISSGKKMLRFEEESKEEDCEEIKPEKVDVACKESFTVLLSKVNSRTCLFTTMKFKNIRSFYVRRDCLYPTEKEETMGHKAEPAHVGSKVLPICEAASSASLGTDYSSDGSVNRKKRAFSRMKELVRWAAAAKSDIGGSRKWKVLYFRNKGALKDPFDERSTSSSKISFRWELGSCSTSSSALSPLSLTSSSSARGTRIKEHSNECSIKESCTGPKGDDYVRMGHWITTDSEFVVLEL